MVTDTKEFVSQNFKQATDNFARAVQTGIKFQEETASFLTQAFGRSSDEFRTQWDKMTQEAVPFNKKSVERFQKMFDEQSSRSLELLRKSFECAVPTSPAEAFEKTFALWRTSLDSMRQSAETTAKLNAELYENWSATMRSGFPGTCCTGANAKPATTTK